MRSSAEVPRDAVVRTILELERACLDTEAALVERRWDGVDAALAHQHELTASLAELFAAAPETAPERDGQIAQRLRGILAYRDDQLQRLEAYRDDVATRLRSLGRLRAFSRAIGKHDPAAALLDGQY